jgi:hypothetical protein
VLSALSPDEPPHAASKPIAAHTTTHRAQIFTPHRPPKALTCRSCDADSPARYNASEFLSAFNDMRFTTGRPG